DLQVQIHVPETKAPKVISMVGSMQNLVNELLQAAVGNHFRNTLQALEAVRFMETRDQVQAAALEACSRYFHAYEVETRGVYIRITGEAEGSRRRAIGLGDAAAVEALGLAKAKGYQAQVASLGSTPTAAVAIANALSEGNLDVMPEVLVTGGGALEGLAATFMRSLNGNGEAKAPK